jgi:hypothetical protein
MAASEELTAAALQALLQDGKLAGSWTLDPARTEVLLETRHTWGLRPLHGVFRQVSGNGTVTAAGDATGIITVNAESIDTKNPQRDKHRVLLVSTIASHQAAMASGSSTKVASASAIACSAPGAEVHTSNHASMSSRVPPAAADRLAR